MSNYFYIIAVVVVIKILFWSIFVCYRASSRRALSIQSFTPDGQVSHNDRIMIVQNEYLPDRSGPGMPAQNDRGAGNTPPTYEQAVKGPAVRPASMPM